MGERKWIKSWAAATAVVVTSILTSCNHEPPAYESKYRPPSSTPFTTTPPPPPPLPTEASFVDDFNRPNSTFGLGEGWDLRGSYLGSFPLPPATDGFIKDGSFTYGGDSIVAAVRQLRSTVRRMGAVGHWAQTRPGAETTLAMAITANDHLFSDVVLFTANRARWDLSVRRANGVFSSMAQRDFAPPLELDRAYQFEIEATDTAVTVRVPDAETTMQVSTVGLLGDRVFWQEFAKPTDLPAGVVFDFDTVWAVEDHQPLLPVPAP
jgi:hypothetical protein